MKFDEEGNEIQIDVLPSEQDIEIVLVDGKTLTANRVCSIQTDPDVDLISFADKNDDILLTVRLSLIAYFSRKN